MYLKCSICWDINDPVSVLAPNQSATDQCRGSAHQLKPCHCPYQERGARHTSWNCHCPYQNVQLGTPVETVSLSLSGTCSSADLLKLLHFPYQESREANKTRNLSPRELAARYWNFAQCTKRTGGQFLISVREKNNVCIFELIKVLVQWIVSLEKEIFGSFLLFFAVSYNASRRKNDVCTFQTFQTDS